MKASPNREQQLFLITGGIIMLLILAVVIFNMVYSPTKLVEEEAASRPVVKLTDNMGRTGQYQGGTMGTAPIFSQRDEDPELSVEEVGGRDVRRPGDVADPFASTQEDSPPVEEPGYVLGGQPQDPRLATPWNRSQAELEDARYQNQRRMDEEKERQAPPPSSVTAPIEEIEEPVEISEEMSIPVPDLEADDDNLESYNAAPPPEPTPSLPVTQARGPAARPDFSQAIADMVKQRQANDAQKTETLAQSVSSAPVAETSAKPRIKIKPQTVAVHSPAPVAPVAQVAQTAQTAVSAGTGYSVQIASLSSRERADQLQEKLRAFMLTGKRMPVHQKSANVKGQTYYRVRLGPFETRAMAEQAGTMVHQQLGFEGRLIKPSEP